MTAFQERNSPVVTGDSPDTATKKPNSLRRHSYKKEKKGLHFTSAKTMECFFSLSLLISLDEKLGI